MLAHRSIQRELPLWACLTLPSHLAPSIASITSCTGLGGDLLSPFSIPLDTDLGPGSPSPHLPLPSSPTLSTLPIPDGVVVSLDITLRPGLTPLSPDHGVLSHWTGLTLGRSSLAAVVDSTLPAYLGPTRLTVGPCRARGAGGGERQPVDVHNGQVDDVGQGGGFAVAGHSPCELALAPAERDPTGEETSFTLLLALSIGWLGSGEVGAGNFKIPNITPLYPILPLTPMALRIPQLEYGDQPPTALRHPVVDLYVAVMHQGH